MPSRIEYIEDVIDRPQPLESAGDRKSCEKAMMTGRIPGFRPRNYLHMNRTRWMVFAGLVVAFLVAIYWHYFSRASIPHEAIQLHLRLTASSIYEFHNATGRWPKVADDLAATSLAQTSPYWRTLIDNGSVAVVWNSDLKPDPKDNASLLLTYNNAGLFSKLGRVWVCWGDLRTEYIKEELLRSQLKSQSR